jgi:hypothetical protein
VQILCRNEPSTLFAFDLDVFENKSSGLEVFQLYIMRNAGVLCHEPLQCLHTIFNIDRRVDSSYRNATFAYVRRTFFPARLTKIPADELG